MGREQRAEAEGSEGIPQRCLFFHFSHSPFTKPFGYIYLRRSMEGEYDRRWWTSFRLSLLHSQWCWMGREDLFLPAPNRTYVNTAMPPSAAPTTCADMCSSTQVRVFHRQPNLLATLEDPLLLVWDDFLMLMYDPMLWIVQVRGLLGAVSVIWASSRSTCCSDMKRSIVVSPVTFPPIFL